MKVTLVNPPSEFVDEDLLHAPPLGLASIAAVLETKGVEVDIIDMAAPGQATGDKDKLRLSGTDVVGISATLTPRFPQAIAISRAIKKADKDIPIVLGGNHATFMHKEILQNYSSVDFIVLYEGEYSFLKLVEALEGRKSLAKMRGIAYRSKNGKVIVTPKAEKVKDLDALPMPARHLLPMELYKKWRETGNIVSSRGCPYRCTFCSTSAFFGHEVRLNSIERVLQEIEYLVEKHHLKQISFSDDLFTFSRARVNALCDMIIEKNLDIKWACFSRVDYVDATLLHKMQKAGCQQILYGVESGSQRILDLCKKHQTVERARKAIELTKEEGIAVCASIILGLPGENHQTVQKTLDFILETKPPDISLHLLVPYPGTRIWEEPEKFGIRILGQEWQYYTQAIPMVETKDLSWGDLLKAKSLIIREYLKAKGEL